MKKKGLSTVVTTLIIILLVLVAIGIVWVVIANVVTEGSEQIFLDKFTTNLELKNVNVDSVANNVTMDVKRNAGKGNLEGLKFIFNDGKNSEIYEQENINLEELGQKRFNFILSNLNVSNIETVSIAPIYKSSSGKKIYGGILAFFNLKKGILINCIDEPVLTTCGSWVCGSTPNNCGRSVSCGTCAPGIEYCSIDRTQCLPIVIPCAFDTIEWSPPGSVVEGTSSSFTITSIGNCNGEDVSVEVWEDDFAPLPDTLITPVPISVQFNGNTAIGTWQASWIDDGGLDPDPEYFLKAVLDNNPTETVQGSQVKADELIVVQVAQPCELSSASWSASSVQQGTQVTLNVVGTNCAGEAITYIIHEDDGLIGDDFVTSISGTYSSATWTATWTVDDDINDNQYYFIASFDGGASTVTSSAPLLSVIKLPGTCSAEGGVICGANEYCPLGQEIPSTEADCCTPGECVLSSCALCTDCDNFFSPCTYSECHSCLGGPCYYKGVLPLQEDCVSLSSVCGSSITQCSQYSSYECNDDPCNLGNCLFDGVSCVAQVFPPTYAIRTFSSSTVPAGGNLNVMLELFVTEALERNATTGMGFVIAYENTSLLTAQGWVVIDDGFGVLASSDDLGWEFSCTNPFCTIPFYQPLPYILQAPPTPGVYTFDGIYVAWGTTATDGDPTLGDTTIQVT